MLFGAGVGGMMGRATGCSSSALKDKCGNRSNASSEVEFRDLEAVMLGEDGRGIATILEMGHLTRLECALSSGRYYPAKHRASYQPCAKPATPFNALWWTRPIMANVLADLAIESEAHMWLAMRAAAALDNAGEKLLNRVITPIAKYWICKRAPVAVAEALECHGGNGFIEDHLMARLYREAPLNGVWEGAGNVICLDVIRALQTPDVAGAVLNEIAAARGAHPALDAMLATLSSKLAKPAGLEHESRPDYRAIGAGAGGQYFCSAMRRMKPAKLFCATRLGGDYGMALGSLPPRHGFFGDHREGAR